MTKRDHAQFSQQDDPQPVVSSKKTKLDPSEAVATLLENSEELIYCINALKKSASPPSSLQGADPVLHERLGAVSRLLVPSLQALASDTNAGESKPEPPSSVVVPSHVSVTKWTTADIPKSLPPLPAVNNSFLETTALTHRSALYSHLGGPQRESYERLEWLGDAFLRFACSSLIYVTFPDRDPGKCSQVREILNRNETLANYTREYGLDKRASLPPEFFADRAGGGTKMIPKERKKILGDLFEAYVGAVLTSDPQHGASRVSSWLRDLWAMQIADKIAEEEKRQASLNTGRTAAKEGGKQHNPANSDRGEAGKSAKTRLAHALIVPGISLRYEDIPNFHQKNRDNNLPLFAVGVFLDGWGEKNLQLGIGVAPGKKEAGNKAAQMALDNKKLMKLYGGKKEAFMAACGPEVSKDKPTRPHLGGTGG